MMYNTRCTKCAQSIGKGVRFNARKFKVGMYLSTPIYEFTMNCHHCPNKLVVRTNPEKNDYDMVEGLDIRNETYSAEAAESVELKRPEE